MIRVTYRTTAFGSEGVALFETPKGATIFQKSLKRRGIDYKTNVVDDPR